MEIDYEPKDGEYEMYVTDIRKNIAYCIVVDDNTKKSYMDVPIGDLEKVCEQEIKPGLIFKVLVTNQGKDISFEYIENATFSKEEIDELIKHYADKYGEV